MIQQIKLVDDTNGIESLIKLVRYLSILVVRVDEKEKKTRR